MAARGKASSTRSESVLGGVSMGGSSPPLIHSGCGTGCTPPSAEDVAALLRRMAHGMAAMAQAGLAGRMPAVSYDAQFLSDACEPTDTEDNDSDAVDAAVALSATAARPRCTMDPVAAHQCNQLHQQTEDELHECNEAGLVMRLRRMGVTATDGAGVGEAGAGAWLHDPRPVHPAAVEGRACADGHHDSVAGSVADGSHADVPSANAWRNRLRAWLGDFCAAAMSQAASSRSSSPGNAAAEAAEAEAEAAAQALVARLHRIVDFTDLVHEDLQDCPRTEDEAALSRRVRVLCPGAAASTIARPECDTASDCSTDTEVAVAAASNDMLSEAVAAAAGSGGAASSERDQVAWLAELDWDNIKAIALQEGLGSGTPIHESLLAKAITPVISLLDAAGVRGGRRGVRGGRRKHAARQQSEQTSAHATAQTAGGHGVTESVTRGLFGGLHTQSKVQWRQAPVPPTQSQSVVSNTVDAGGAESAKTSFAKIKWRHASTAPPDVTPDVALALAHSKPATQAAHAGVQGAGSRRDSKSEQTSAHATAHTPQGSGSLRAVSRDSKTAAPLVTLLGVSGTPSNIPQPSRGDAEPFDWIPGAHDDATFRF